MEQKALLKLYDPNMQRQGVIDVFRSLVWTRKYHECGNFELHAPLNQKNLNLLSEGNLVAKQNKKTVNDRIVKETAKESGIIEGLVIDDETNEITATGRFLSSMMDRRAIKTVVNFANTTEIVMRNLIATVTAMPFVQLGALKGYTGTIEGQVSYTELYTYMCQLSKYSNLGFRFSADYKNKAIDFEVYEGVDRSMSQNQRSRVIFSETHRNLSGARYTRNTKNMKTCAIVAGEGEGINRTIVEVGSGSGWDLREVIVDARDIQSTDMTETQYNAALTQRGNEKLATYGIVESLEAVTQPFVNFIYKEDYDLGDIVTARKEAWSIGVNKRITELQEIYENGGFSVVPTFGDPLPETIELS